VTFDPAAYGPAVAAILIDGVRDMPLGPGTPVTPKRSALAAFDPARDLTGVRDTNAAKACHAGLWLLYDFHDESHAISQDLPTPEGSAWHAILHRRESDAWNSNYWWKRVGSHPFLDDLRRDSPSIGYEYKTPESFVAYCERNRGTGSSDEATAVRVQTLEWQRLFDHCFRKAITGSVRDWGE
jgi:hypothetical protein